MPKITVLILGGSHRDPVIPSLALKHMRDAHSKGIKVAYCPEISSEQTAEIYHDRNKQCSESAKRGIAHCELLKYARKDLTAPYFLEAAFDDIMCAMKYHIKPESHHQVYSSAIQVIRCLSNLGEIDLMEWVLKNKIRFQAIESVLHNPKVSDEEVLQNDFERTSGFAKKTLDLLGEFQESGGLIVCTGGYLHSQRFAGHLLRFLETSLINFELQVLPVIALSAYVPDAQSTAAALIEKLPWNGQEDLKPSMSLIPVPILKIEDCADKPYFESPDLSDLFIKALFLSKDGEAPLVVIPRERVDQINAMGGIFVKYLETDSTKAFIQIPTIGLTKEVRSQFDLDKRKLTFPDCLKLRLNYLLQNPLLTVEPTEDPEVVMVTFPKNQLVYVTKAIKDYPQLVSNVPNVGAGAGAAGDVISSSRLGL
jgi:hypothetical protein